MFILARNFLAILLCISLSACSVVMATRNNGDDPRTLAKCTNRTCLLAAGVVSMEQKRTKQGKLYSEDFRAILPTGSALRACMHGLLDVASGGLWEVIGTPIEAMKNKKKGYLINVTYNADGETIKHMIFKF